MNAKKYFGLLAAVAVVAAAGWSYQQSKQYDGLSELAIENVNALARSESDPNEGKGMKKEICYDNRGSETGARCVHSDDPYSECHYRHEQWGKCN